MPAALRPMRFPAKTLLFAPAMVAPRLVLPEITLPAPGAVPPIVFALALLKISTPGYPLAIAAVPAGFVPM